MMLPQKLKKRNDHCKHWVHVRDLAERLASLCAVVGCLILDVHLLIKSSKYPLYYCAWLFAIQRNYTKDCWKSDDELKKLSSDKCKFPVLAYLLLASC